MLVEYVSEGKRIDHTPGADVAAGDVVVQGDLLGVATRDIKSGELGSLLVAGNVTAPKAAGGSTAIAAGTIVYWDAAEAVVKADSETGANKLFGKVTKAAADADTSVEVLKTA